MLKSISQIQRLSKKYRVPEEDIILIGLNCLGAQANIPDTRIRFKLKLNTFNELFYLAICINTSKTPFLIKKNNLYFYNEQIGKIIEEEKDTCDATYFRRNKTALTLNSNSRSQCQGCKFCGTYRQEAEDIFNLLSPKRLSLYITQILQKSNLKDLSKIIDIGICTGCFKNEKETLSHILMVRHVLKKFGFNQELKYIGSQITSKASLDILKKQHHKFTIKS